MARCNCRPRAFANQSLLNYQIPPLHLRTRINALHRRYIYPLLLVASTKTGNASASSYDADLQKLLLAGPPPHFDFRAEVTACSQRWIDEHAPQLRDLVNDGTLVVVPRRPDYVERRTDGYTEPGVVLLVGTAHVSRRSQRDVDRVIRAVLPDSVVVELCKSRSAALMATDSSDSTTHGSNPPPPPPGAAAAAGGPPNSLDTGDVPPSSYQQQQQPQQQHEKGQLLGALLQRSPSSDSVSPPTTCSESDSAATTSAPPQSPPSLLSTPPRPYINPLNLAGGWEGGGGGGEGGTVGSAGGGGGGFLGAVARSVALGGQSALLLRVLLAGLASRTAGSLGVAGGGEFAAARAAAEYVGAQVVLGDRPVEITLSRAWGSLPLTRRLALCGELMRGMTGSSQQSALNEELVERLKSDDAVSAFFSQMSASYPELVAPLVTERDLYLAWSLKRSKAVNGASRVVGVVGRGHMRGVVYALLQDQGGAGLRFTDLVDGKNSRKRRTAEAAQVAARLGVELALGAAAYYGWLAFSHQT